MASFLKEKARLGKFHIEVEEVDISRRDDDDLSQEAKQEEILRRIGWGEFDAVICTPPCSTWSRVRAANMRGPPPIRDKNYPWGYPWVKKKFEQELQLGNILVRFTIRVVETALGVYKVFVLVEHPEDLGTVVREEDKAVLKPASIWQLPDLRRLVGERLATVAINQCCWGAAWRKPTRLLTTSGRIKQWGPNEWPSLDEEGFYEGPLRRLQTRSLSTALTDTQAFQRWARKGHVWLRRQVAMRTETRGRRRRKQRFVKRYRAVWKLAFQAKQKTSV